MLFYREYHQCEREKKICISCWFGSVIDYNMFILTGHFSELDISAYCSYTKELLYFDVVLQLKEKECTVFLSTWILSWQKKNIIVFAVYVDKFKFFLFTPQNISSACIPRKFPSRAVSGADNMKLAVQSSERKTFFSSYRIVSEFPVREYSI